MSNTGKVQLDKYKSYIVNMRKKEIKEYAAKYNIELDTTNYKREMLDNLWEVAKPYQGGDKDGHGGKRENSGRPAGTENESTKIKRKMRRRLTQRVNEKLDEIIEAQIDLATGHFYKDTSGDQDKIYLKSPNSRAAKNLIDQAIGKAKDSLELSTEDGEEVLTIAKIEKIKEQKANEKDE